MRAVLFSVALGALALSGCSLRDEGPRTTQTRQLAAFTRIDNRDSVDIDVRVGAPQVVRVRAGKNVLDDVRTEVRDGTLEVRYDGDAEVTLEATVERLTGIEASGTGDVRVQGVSADALEIRSDGAADIAVDGVARRVLVELDGSGSADLVGLAAREATVRVGGSGDAEVRAAHRLEADVDGSGDIRYHGEPQLTQRVVGSGNVSQAG